MEAEIKAHYDKILESVKRTGRYNEADNVLIEHAALTLSLIEKANKELKKSGMIQTFKTGAKQIAPEINNLRGLLADFRKYCDDLGLSPAARKSLDIQIVEEKKVSRIMQLRKAK